MKIPAELKIKYLNRRLAEIGRLRSTLEQDDYSLALQVGHQVKGNAVTFEVPQIAVIGFEMEEAAQRQDKQRIKLLVHKLEVLLSAALEPYLPALG